MVNSSIQKIKQGIDERMKGGKTFPALYALFNTHFMPEKLHIVGYARTKMSRKEFHERISTSLKNDEHEGNENISQFLDICHYVSGQYDEDDSFKNLDKFVTDLEEKAEMKKEQRNRIFYMALPPDLESSNSLSTEIGKLYEPEQNLMYVRFANRIFSSLWNASHIDSVQITMKEAISTEGRGGYFDEYGIIRDVMQNHLLQLFCMVAMERPIARDAEAIRDEKVKVLRCVKPVKLEDTLLGQYVSNGKVPGYREDESVPDDSLTATFATMVLWIDNERWDNVPFILKAGKAMDSGKAEIRIHPTWEAMYMKFNNKVPGFSYDTMITELDLTYKNRYKNLNIPEAYENMILDVMRGDHSTFVRDDELKAAWRIFTPLLHQIEEQKIKPEPYPYGTRGPKKLDEFVKRYGVERLEHENYQWPLHQLD
ncbi:uncharacterized protein BX663DRAFT_522240 [Cokeromyces recurvatus]|uniref:uncharacterized protein n=1 Tax=Cokeromyces recurvatus TaxID=90255 RepID=UPI00221FA9EB|nr:uncharacterized protein BX663DRAFT_522240 [Cokeromyces recurvatus]KAI7899086.1 hypothetical protein BX663DRAFT_522240 [Cokeromyces recurvatus]